MILLCFILGQPEVLAELKHAELTESSGVCVSADGKLVWTHNDSGDAPRLFGFRRSGELAVMAHVPAAAVDWEDICSFERDGKDYLAVGDIGDNQRRRKSVTIYVLEEPDLGRAGRRTRSAAGQSSTGRPPSDQAIEISVRVVCELHVTFPSGSIDCEGIAYDPLSESFLLTSKELLRTRLFEVDASNLAAKQMLKASLIGIVLVPMVTGADISRDGTQLVLSTYGPGCMLGRKADDNWSNSADDMQFFEMPQRRQGESICFDKDGQQLLLTSEFAPSPLYCIANPEAGAR